MRRLTSSIAFAGVMLALASHASGAWSAEAEASAAAPVAPAEAGPAAMTQNDLGDMSGGQSVTVTTTVLSQNDLKATTSGNTINAQTVTSGPISFSNNALNAFAGVGNFVVNTGANNTLQGSISISILTAAPPL
jgi:hypothetical protein